MLLYLRENASPDKTLPACVTAEEEVEQQPKEREEYEHHNPRQCLYGITVPEQNPDHDNHCHNPVQPIEDTHYRNSTPTHYNPFIFAKIKIKKQKRGYLASFNTSTVRG
jgi:hypothetical protein